MPVRLLNDVWLLPRKSRRRLLDPGARAKVHMSVDRTITQDAPCGTAAPDLLCGSGLRRSGQSHLSHFALRSPERPHDQIPFVSCFHKIGEPSVLAVGSRSCELDLLQVG